MPRYEWYWSPSFLHSNLGTLPCRTAIAEYYATPEAPLEARVRIMCSPHMYPTKCKISGLLFFLWPPCSIPCFMIWCELVWTLHTVSAVGSKAIDFWKNEFMALMKCEGFCPPNVQYFQSTSIVTAQFLKVRGSDTSDNPNDVQLLEVRKSWGWFENQMKWLSH